MDMYEERKSIMKEASTDYLTYEDGNVDEKEYLPAEEPINLLTNNLYHFLQKGTLE